jgi:hypothetical protein
MSGLYISCGDFRAGDQAGTAFERVLGELPEIPPQARQKILSGFDVGEHTLIDPDDAAALVPSLTAYRDRLVMEIGHADWLQEMESEERSGVCSIKLKWGEGRGSRLYCAVSLLAACERSALTRQPVLICLA